jgi:glycosyltransferase involved in cell wall biosynthesis
MTTLKGGDVLIGAAAAANRRLDRPVRLLMAGDGPERGRWTALASRLGVAAEFTGWLGGTELAALFRRASIVAVPSLWPEPFGLVGLDAAVHGVPAVAFAAGGISQWLRDGVNGRLVPEIGDPQALGSAIAAMVENPAELDRLGRGAAAVARELDINTHVATLERVFTRAVDGAARA